MNTVNMAKNNQYKIFITTLIVLILSLIGLFILITQSNMVPHPGTYYIKCYNGSVVSFNQSDLLVCNGVNPLSLPRINKYKTYILK